MAETDYKKILKTLRSDRDKEVAKRHEKDAKHQKRLKGEMEKCSAERADKLKYKDALESILQVCKDSPLREARSKCKDLAEKALS